MFPHEGLVGRAWPVKPHEFLLECAQPTGGIVGRFSTSLRGPGLFD
jgi:hypothetical protein